MKKIMAFAFTMLLVTAVSAQDEQETNKDKSGDSPSMWLGGELTFGSMSNLDFTFGPNFGLMLGDNIGAGIALVISSGNSEFQWAFEPYFRYYIPVVDRFSFYGDAFIGVGGGDNDTSNDGGEYSTLDFGVRAGLQYWFTPRWSVAASTNVLTYNSRDNNGEFGAGLSFNTVQLSLFFHF